MKYFYAIWDKVAERYSVVMEHNDDAIRMRTFRMECKNPQSFLCNFIDDYDLYKVAEFNEEKGTFENYEKPKLICHATRFKEDKNGVQTGKI